MHRITDNRLSGSAKRNLQIFQRMCGQKALKNTVFLTSMWSSPPASSELVREEELKRHPCVMSNSMATVARLESNVREETRRILRTFVGKVPEALDIQVDMVQGGKTLHDTEAAHTIDPQLIEAIRARETQVKTETQRREHARLEVERQRRILEQQQREREVAKQRHEEEMARAAQEQEERVRNIPRPSRRGPQVYVSVTIPCVIM